MAEPARIDTSIPSRLHFGRLKPAEACRTVHRANVPAGVDLATVLDPGYLGHYTKVLTAGDILEVVCDDGSWMAWLWVMFVGTAEVKCQTIWETTFEKASQADVSETHKIKWISPTRKYAVVRKDDGKVLKDMLYPESEAAAYLRQHLKNIEAKS